MLTDFASSRHCAISLAICAPNSLDPAAHRIDAVALQAFGDFGGTDRAFDRRGEFFDHRLRRSGRRHDAHPQHALVAGQSHLGDGRHLRQLRRTCPRRVGERAQLARRDVLIGGRIGVHLELHLSGQQVGHGGRGAAIRNMRDLDAEAAQQQLHRDVRQRAVAGRGIVQLAGIGLGVGDEALEVRERRRRMAHQQLGHFRHHGDRHEILLGVERQFRLQRRVDGVVRRGEQQRVAVGRGLGGRVGCDHAARAAAVLDHERGLQIVRHPRGDEPRHQIDRAAGRERHDQPDRPLRIFCPRAARPTGEPGAQRQRDQASVKSCHALPRRKLCGRPGRHRHHRGGRHVCLVTP